MLPQIVARLFFVSVICLFLTSRLVAQDARLPAHGTVNILLANSSGIVAVRTSRLRFRGIQTGSGQKLFKLDDHIDCTIAGWYSAPDPQVDPTSFTYQTSIPKLMQMYLLTAKDRLQGMSVEEKLDSGE